MKTNAPQSISTNNTAPQTTIAPIDPKGRRLRQTMEHLTLERMIEQLRQQELDPDALCKMLHTYCELKKSDVAAEKNRVALQIAQQPKRAPLSTSRQCHPFDDCPDDQEPVYSNIATDQPSPLAASHKNFRRTLRQAVADIYGINLDIDYDPHSPPANNPLSPRLCRGDRAYQPPQNNTRPNSSRAPP